MSAQVAIVWGAEDRAMPVIAPLCCQFEFVQDVLMSLCNISTARLCTRSKSSPLNVGVGFGNLITAPSRLLRQFEVSRNTLPQLLIASTTRQATPKSIKNCSRALARA
jgi:hypothetical protein